ncbi:hypothetical protein K501DRAFT_281586 [Backusella circina FSU 941]|nr:hypothetical protein K501DRAFT_281586 [Backusella circina FSU 941]
MDRLPFEISLQIFEYLPFSSFQTIYKVFPEELIDEALKYKLRNSKNKPLLSLVSTNLHELSAPIQRKSKKNESALDLFYTSFASSDRLIWTTPDFTTSQHYFKVKDTYVSHGKLVVRPHGNITCESLYCHDKSFLRSLTLVSLWDIRKSLPPTRAGSFSGASEFSYHRANLHEITIAQSGCILDSCLMPFISTHKKNAGREIKLSVSKKMESGEMEKMSRPTLPISYERKIPASFIESPWGVSSSFPDSICGYFLVERVAISISTFLELLC